MTTRKVAGLLLLLAGAFILLGIVTAEMTYPEHLHYSTANNEVSDLGATRPPNSVRTHPSSELFNLTMGVTGLMILSAAGLLRREFSRRSLPYVMAAFGVSVFLVAIFPGNNAVTHPIVAMGAFVFGGLTCIASGRIATGPLRHISRALGVTTLSVLLFASRLVPTLGDGGTERWIVYPVVIWLVAFGGYVLGDVSSLRVLGASQNIAIKAETTESRSNV